MVLWYEANPALGCEADSKHGNISSLNSIYDTSRKFSTNLRYKTRGIILSCFQEQATNWRIVQFIMIY